MKRLPLFFLLALFLLTAASRPSPAAEFSPHPLWRGETIADAQGQLSNCAVVRDYADHDSLTLAYAKDGQWLLLLIRHGLQPPPGWRGFITISVDDGLDYQAAAQTVGEGVLVDLTRADGVRAMLAMGQQLRLVELNPEPYPLDGAGAAMAAAVRCFAGPQPSPAAPADAATGASPPTLGKTAAHEIVADMDTYANLADAEEDWHDIARKMAAVFAGRSPVFATRTRAQDARVFVVMRFTGFKDTGEAQRFCQGLQARKRACTVRQIEATTGGERP